jgi:hypothetical protein
VAKEDDMTLDGELERPGEQIILLAEQAPRYPGFAEYEQNTQGIRIIPVLALTRNSAKTP